MNTPNQSTETVQQPVDIPTAGKGMSTYRISVLYYYADGQSNGHMEVQADNETDAIIQVLQYMQRSMKLHPEYRIHMVQVSKI